MKDAELVQRLNSAVEAGRNKAQKSGCVRKRRHDKREMALKFYFEQIAAGRDVWRHIEMIYEKAPKLTERVAGEHGVTELKFDKM